MAQAKPAKRTEKVQVMLDEQELQAIDDWRFDNRVPTRAAAIRELLRRGLGDGEAPRPALGRSTRDFRVTGPEEAGS